MVHVSHLVTFPDLLAGLAPISANEARLSNLLLLLKVLTLRLLSVEALVFFAKVHMMILVA